MKGQCYIQLHLDDSGTVALSDVDGVGLGASSSRGVVLCGRHDDGHCGSGLEEGKVTELAKDHGGDDQVGDEGESAEDGDGDDCGLGLITVGGVDGGVVGHAGHHHGAEDGEADGAPHQCRAHPVARAEASDQEKAADKDGGNAQSAESGEEQSKERHNDVEDDHKNVKTRGGVEHVLNKRLLAHSHHVVHTADNTTNRFGHRHPSQMQQKKTKRKEEKK